MTLQRVFLDIFLWVFLKSQNGSFLIVCDDNSYKELEFECTNGTRQYVVG